MMAVIVVIAVVIVITIVIMSVSVIMVTIPVLVALLEVVLIVVLAVMGRVHLTVPAVRHEVDRAATRIVLVTMSRPMPLVSGRHVQVERLRGRYADDHRSGHGYDGTRSQQLRTGEIAERDRAVNAGCAHTNRDVDITGARERAET